jgi:hypothetical protein
MQLCGSIGWVHTRSSVVSMRYGTKANIKYCQGVGSWPPYGPPQRPCLDITNWNGRLVCGGTANYASNLMTSCVATLPVYPAVN